MSDQFEHYLTRALVFVAVSFLPMEDSHFIACITFSVLWMAIALFSVVANTGRGAKAVK
jgi:hypothetical protein